jgi:hypothetical protein
VFSPKERFPHAPLHPIISISPFCMWGFDFMECKPLLFNGHKYIVVAIDYFTKWVKYMPKYMPTVNDKVDTTTHFGFNRIVTQFHVMTQLILDHFTHFQDAF